MARVNTSSSNTIFLKIYKTLYSSLGPQHWWPGETPFEIMVGAILTQNTNWNNVSTAIEKIKKADLMHPKKLLAGKRKIPQLIKPSGFYRMKAKYLHAFLRYYIDDYNGSIEKLSAKETHVLRKELMSIPGIGPETADSILLYALGKRIFVVDAYTRRIFSRHKIIVYDQPYDTVQETIERNLPSSTKLYNEFHALLVKTGKEYCKRNDPLCNTCPLGTMLP
jgi:endonuclease-3 related protein